MKRRITTTAVAALALMLPGAITTAQSATAAATIPGCSASVNVFQNSATALCSISGSFRVTASCVPNGWLGLPITVYGPWKNPGSSSIVYGNAQVLRCVIVQASIQFR